MNTPFLDVIVIGAGHAGLSISYYLKKLNLNHIVFETGLIGNTWRNQRWDSFKLNTPNKMNLLPGQDNGFSDEDGFCSSQDFVSSLEEYSKRFHLPVIENCKVLLTYRVPGSRDIFVNVMENGSPKYYRARNIVVASGAQNIKSIPSFAGNISPDILQLHTGEYRNSSSLPDGAVLIVGSAQSGVQIAEDLASRGRKVFISTSQVARVPRRYRGKDIVDWLLLTGFYDLRTDDVTDPQVFRMKQPQISNAGLRGHTLSLQGLARRGVVILGKTKTADDKTIFLQPNAADHIKFADEFSKKVKKTIDEYILKAQLNASLPEEDPDDESAKDSEFTSAPQYIDLVEKNITTIIWATGFAGDFGYLKFPVFDDHGLLKHTNGISDIEGLYFLGIPWLRKRKSGIIMGIKEDAEFIINKIMGQNR